MSDSKQRDVTAEHVGGSETPDKGMQSNTSPATPSKDGNGLREMRHGGGGTSELRALKTGPYAPGPQTFDHKYMPFAGGFSHMANEAAVYRSTRLHAINPTAAVSDDISYYYTLDSGRVPPAVQAANPDTSEEFVRNTRTGTQGGMWSSIMKPIR